MTRLSIGRFINSLLQDLKSAHENNGEPQEKLKLYSGHDTTLIPLLVALEQYPSSIGWPPFSSYVAIEVHRSVDGELHVRVVYNDQVLNCGGSRDYCGLVEFVEKLQEYSLKEEEYRNLCDVC